MIGPLDGISVTFRQAGLKPAPKTTVPGWPDPTEWVNQLHKDMAAWTALYDSTKDPLRKRHMAASLLGHVIADLLVLPAFKNDSVHLPLKDLMIFLSDLDRGRDHPWSAPVNFGGTNITTTAQSELKIWIRAAFRVLRANGFKPVEAYRHIATGLTVSGRRGRNDGPVRWQRVQAWCQEEEQGREQKVREKLEKWWADFRLQDAGVTIIDARGQPVPGREIAGRFVDLCWSLDHLRDRSFSGVSE